MKDFKNIDHNRKLIFLHPNRCGGKSIEQILWNRDPNIKTSDHHTSEQYVNKYGLKVWNEYFKFGFCRNPWDRIASLYFYRKNNLNNFPFLDLRDYLDNGYKVFPRDFKPQSLYFFYENRPIDFIGKFENYEDSYNELKHKLGISNELVKLNSSKNRLPYRKIFEKYTIAKVEEIFSIDIENFKYKF